MVEDMSSLDFTFSSYTVPVTPSTGLCGGLHEHAVQVQDVRQGRLGEAGLVEVALQRCLQLVLRDGLAQAHETDVVAHVGKGAVRILLQQGAHAGLERIRDGLSGVRIRCRRGRLGLHGHGLLRRPGEGRGCRPSPRMYQSAPTLWM